MERKLGSEGGLAFSATKAKQLDPEGGAAYLGVRSGYDLGTIWVRAGYELGTSCSVAGCTNWVRTRYELDANWMRTGNGYSKFAATKPILNWRGQGGESVAGKAKGDSHRGFEETQCRDKNKKKQAKKRPSHSPGS